MPLLLNKGIFLFPVVKHAIGVRSLLVIERIFLYGIDLIPGMKACALVEHDIKNNSNAVLVTDIDKLLIVLSCTVSFIDCEVEVRIVNPRVVAVKFIDRKILNCIDA